MVNEDDFNVEDQGAPNSMETNNTVQDHVEIISIYSTQELGIDNFSQCFVSLHSSQQQHSISFLSPKGKLVD